MKLIFFILLFLNTPLIIQAKSGCVSSLTHLLPSKFWTQTRKNTAHRIIMAASDNLSRTISSGRRFMAPQSFEESEIARIAAKNFERTVKYVLNNLDKLEINLKTAIRLNKMLTKDLVPDQVRGNVDFRRLSPNRVLSDDFVNGSFYRFYKWLDSLEAKELHQSNPIEFAEKIHHNLVALDSFPDGNGRLSRLLSDLALMQRNLPPAYYTDINDYFATGNALSEVSREEMRAYYHRIVQRGIAAMNGDLEIIEQ